MATGSGSGSGSSSNSGYSQYIPPTPQVDYGVELPATQSPQPSIDAASVTLQNVKAAINQKIAQCIGNALATQAQISACVTQSINQAISENATTLSALGAVSSQVAQNLYASAAEYAASINPGNTATLAQSQSFTSSGAVIPTNPVVSFPNSGSQSSSPVFTCQKVISDYKLSTGLDLTPPITQQQYDAAQSWFFAHGWSNLLECIPKPTPIPIAPIPPSPISPGGGIGSGSGGGSGSGQPPPSSQPCVNGNQTTYTPEWFAAHPKPSPTSYLVSGEATNGETFLAPCPPYGPVHWFTPNDGQGLTPIPTPSGPLPPSPSGPCPPVPIVKVETCRTYDLVTDLIRGQLTDENSTIIAYLGGTAAALINSSTLADADAALYKLTPHLDPSEIVPSDFVTKTPALSG